MDSSTQESSHMLQNIPYKEGYSFNDVIGNVQESWKFLQRFRILEGLDSSEFANALLVSQETSVTVEDIETTVTYELTFRRAPGNAGLNVSYKVAKNGIKQDNTPSGQSTMDLKPPGSGAIIHHNKAKTRAEQANSANGNGTSVCYNEASDDGTRQTNTATTPTGINCIIL